MQPVPKASREWRLWSPQGEDLGCPGSPSRVGGLTWKILDRMAGDVVVTFTCASHDVAILRAVNKENKKRAREYYARQDLLTKLGRSERRADKTRYG